jgi:hypothetical protein
MELNHCCCPNSASGTVDVNGVVSGAVYWQHLAGRYGWRY